MTESDLVYFVSVTNTVEYHWHEDNVILFVDHFLIKEFMTLLGNQFLTDRETECVLKDGYIAVWMKDICDYFDIDMEKVFRNGK